tara:strand:+ start:78 stop:434 length:357 start_codon:yes stop_codon:yes gene_type:complete
MSNVKIYHNPRCSKSRQALQIIKGHGVEPKVIEYLKEPLCKGDLKNIAKSLGVRPKEFVRKNEAEFKDNNLAAKLEKDDDLFEAMAKFPKIMERPIIISDLGAVIGRPPENALKVLET